MPYALKIKYWVYLDPDYTINFDFSNSDQTAERRAQKQGKREQKHSE